MRIYKIAQGASGYSPIEGKTKEQLRQELMDVFNKYPEYNDPAYGGGDFMNMVNKFAQDDFYKLHFVARAYQKAVWESRETEHTCPACGEKGPLANPYSPEGEKEYEDRMRRLREQRENRKTPPTRYDGKV